MGWEGLIRFVFRWTSGTFRGTIFVVFIGADIGDKDLCDKDLSESELYIALLGMENNKSTW